MIRIPNDCEPCSKAELGLWNKRLLQKDIEYGNWQTFLPSASFTESTTVSWNIQADGDLYTSLWHSYLEMGLKIVKADGTPIGADEKVAFINNIGHAFWSHVKLDLNGTEVTSSRDTYHMKAHDMVLLSYGSNAKRSQLGCFGWAKDTAGHMNEAGPNNKGWTARQKWTSASRTLGLVCPLAIDLWQVQELLPNGINIKLKLTRNPNEIILHQPADNTTAYRVLLQTCELHLRRVKLSPSTLLEQAKNFTLGPAVIPINRIETITHSVPQGVKSTKIDNVTLGDLPECMVISALLDSSLNGDINTTPDYRQHFHISKVAVIRDGQSVPAVPLTPDFENNQFIRCYQSIFAATGKWLFDEGLDITRDDYPKGYTYFAFNFSPDLSNGELVQPNRAGNVRLDIEFARPTQQPIQLVMQCSFYSTVKITRARDVLIDYTP